MRGYRDLKVWQRGRSLAIEVYRLTAAAPFRSDWALRDQLRRSAVSVPSNIAEGNQRFSDPDSIRFFRIALGSLAELSTQADIAGEVGMLDSIDARRCISECDELAGMLNRLIQARRR